MLPFKSTVVLLFIFYFLSFTTYCFSQEIKEYNLPFFQNNIELGLANIGGMNNPQFSQADLNNDGIADLYVFDYSAKKHLAFVWDNNQWNYASELTVNFPELESWAFLRDFNQDGIADIFAYAFDTSSSGLIVYEGFWNENVIDFKRYLFDGYLQAYDVFNDYQAVYLSQGEVPAIGDVDNDEDIDLLTFGNTAGYLNYYQNQSVELGFDTDTLLFELVETCWGGFLENGNGGVFFSENPGECASGGKSAAPPHGNSTINIIDYNEDGLTDLLISDIGSLGIKLLVNSGTTEVAHITESIADFPPDDVPINIQYTPYLYLVDADMDGRTDILASPQLPNSENVAPVHFYKNEESSSLYNFKLENTNFLNEYSLDFGTGSHPVIVDVNADGLLDIVVGNYGFFLEGGDREARLILCLNKGTTDEPIYEITDTDWLGLSVRDEWYLTPTFADLDNDEDLDLIYGSALGMLFHFENIAGAGNPMEFGEIDSAWMDIQTPGFIVGQRTVPTFSDLDEDGLLDMILGEKNGNVNFFKNLGTADSPFYNPNLNHPDNNGFLGNIDMRKPGSTVGFSAPNIINHNNEKFLLIGSDEIGVRRYDEINVNASDNFMLTDTTFLDDRIGQNLHIAAADINNDGFLDFVCGHERGGLSFYTEQDALSNLHQPLDQSIDIAFELKDQYIELNGNALSDTKLIQLFDMKGRQILKNEVDINANSLKVDIFGINPGIYILTISGKYGITSFKFSWN